MLEETDLAGDGEPAEENNAAPGAGGVLTPATAMGDELVARLRATGQHSIDVVER